MQITEIFCYQAKITPDCIFEELSSRYTVPKVPGGEEGRGGKGMVLLIASPLRIRSRLNTEKMLSIVHISYS